jgi:uncharacterized membrane-anchored protein YhcB (DUF1043 family)
VEVLTSTIPVSAPSVATIAPEIITTAPSIAGWSGGSVLLVAVCAFVAGAIVALKVFRPTNQKTSDTLELQGKLDKSNQQLKLYQQEISEHFITVSHLTANITQSYKQIHEHLASSAIRLASPEIGRQLLKSGGANLSLHDAEGNPLVNMEDIQAPKDYAPKVPGGVLSEEYGLVESENEENTEMNPGIHDILEEETDPTQSIS